jgi:lipopolysaccharide/colanic/teichoic acid biosynthesis glycosyltransferase
METTHEKKLKIAPIEPGNLKIWRSLFLKRSFDIILSGLGLLALTPLFLLIALAIKRDSFGPVFYRGARVGRGGKPFGILKFRTMRECAESYQGPRITTHDDTRITPLGQWLRDTKLNELPQLWNVLMGEMSLVGPRPEDPEFVIAWPDDAQTEILSVRPGMTSPASISYHDEEKLLSGENLLSDYMGKIAPDKLRLDRLYVRHRTFMTDLDAIFWTLIVLIPRIGPQPKTEGRLFGGPFTRLVRPYFTWTLIDFFISIFAAALVGGIWRIFRPLDIGWEWAPIVALVFSLQFGLVNSLLGLHRVEWSRAAAEDSFGLLLSCGVVSITSMLLDFLMPAIKVPDGYLIIASSVAAFGFVGARYRLRLITGFASRWVGARGYGVGERVLVVGAGAGGEMATWLLRRPDFKRLFNVVGYVDDAPSLQGMRYDGIPVIGTTADIPTLVRKEDVGLVFYAIGKIATQDRIRILDRCRQSKARLVILSDILQSVEMHFFPEVSGESNDLGNLGENVQ